MRDPQIDKAIELYALYETPQSAFKVMKSEYGDNCISAGEVKRIREKYRPQIVERRKELMGKIPILDPMERYAYLQQIIDGALEPVPLFDRQGNQIGEFVDRKNALAALKQAHDQTHTEGAVNTEDDDLVKSIVSEAFEEMKKKNPDISDKELLEQMLDELPTNAKVYIEELKTEVANG